MNSRAAILGSLQIVCSASGQPPRAARRQRVRRKAPLPSFEEKLEQQRQSIAELGVQEPLPPAEDFLASPAPVSAPSIEDDVVEGENGAETEAVEAEIIDADGRVVQNENAAEEAEDSPQARARANIERKARALMDIMQAGASVEEAIARHAADVDAAMLSLLDARMEAARQLERNEEVIQGLEALRRRLKAEMDRQKASAALRLLDTLMGVMDSEQEGGRDAEAPKLARAKLRDAFGGEALQADVMSVASQLVVAGPSVADELLEERVDPNVFMHECTELLDRAMEQQRQLAAALETLPADAPERPRVREVMAERALSIALVEEILVLARAEIGVMGRTPRPAGGRGTSGQWRF